MARCLCIVACPSAASPRLAGSIYNEVNLGRIQKAIDAGKLDAAEPITVESLMKAGVVTRRRDGVKILGVGELKTKATFEVAARPRAPSAAIEKAGGSVKTLRQADRSSGALKLIPPAEWRWRARSTIC